MTEEEQLPYLRALIAVAHSDGVLDGDEARTIEGAALSLGLEPEALARIRRDLAQGLEVSQALGQASLSLETRCRLLRDAYLLAWSDELMTPEEHRALAALVVLLGLEALAPRIQSWAERELAMRRDWEAILAAAAGR